MKVLWYLISLQSKEALPFLFPVNSRRMIRPTNGNSRIKLRCQLKAMKKELKLNSRLTQMLLLLLMNGSQNNSTTITLQVISSLSSSTAMTALSKLISKSTLVVILLEVLSLTLLLV